MIFVVVVVDVVDVLDVVGVSSDVVAVSFSYFYFI